MRKKLAFVLVLNCLGASAVYAESAPPLGYSLFNSSNAGAEENVVASKEQGAQSSQDQAKPQSVAYSSSVPVAQSASNTSANSANVMTNVNHGSMYSASAPSYSSPFKGFYLEAGLGGINANFEVRQQFQVIIFSRDALLATNNYNTYGNSVLGLFGLGYTQPICPHFALDLEATADVENAHFTKENILTGAEETLAISNTLSGKLENSFALLVKPDFIIGNNTLLYALIGPRWGNFRTTVSGRLFAADFGGASVSDSTSGYVTGITAGVGLERYLCHGLSLGLQYAYTDYGNIPTPGNFTDSVVIDGVQTHGIAKLDKINVHTNTILGNLVYRFS